MSKITIREVVDLRLGRRLKMMTSITNDEMDRLRDQIREEVLQEQRYWNKKRKDHALARLIVQNMIDEAEVEGG